MGHLWPLGPCDGASEGRAGPRVQSTRRFLTLGVKKKVKYHSNNFTVITCYKDSIYKESIGFSGASQVALTLLPMQET